MRQATALVGSLVLAGVLAADAAAQAPASTSAEKAKELVALMSEKKLETYAARDGDARYVAALVIPNVQILLVSCQYTRSNDIEYALYHKQYQNAYQDLRSSVFASDKFLIDDAQMNGLIAAPGKNPQHDAVTIEKDRQVFDGMHGDGKGRNAKKPLTEAYLKSFADADARYAKLLDVLIAQLKAGK